MSIHLLLSLWLTCQLHSKAQSVDSNLTAGTQYEAGYEDCSWVESKAWSAYTLQKANAQAGDHAKELRRFKRLEKRLKNEPADSF